MKDSQHRPTFAQEIFSTAGRFPESLRRKVSADGSEAQLARYCLQYILQNNELITKFGIEGSGQLQEIGRGWHGVTYRIGNYVMKINHKSGPVIGFEYTQTPEGALFAQHHLQILQQRAKEHGIPDLVDDDQAVFYIPTGDRQGRLVSIQTYHEKLFTPQNLHSIAWSQMQRTKIRQELQDFRSFVKDLNLHDGLSPDVFGERNLALVEKNGQWHFVLCDTGPVDKKIAGPIAQFGMKIWLGKENTRWTIALGIDSRRRSKGKF